jgi:hypothetical protein
MRDAMADYQPLISNNYYQKQISTQPEKFTGKIPDTSP